MARIVSKESVRQVQQGAKAFSPKERPAGPSLDGKKYLVLGDYVRVQGDEYRYMNPRKIVQQFGLDPAQCVEWHAAMARPPEFDGLRVVTIEGLMPLSGEEYEL